jgi:peptidoglycan hydrolase CwlO-like protein
MLDIPISTQTVVKEGQQEVKTRMELRIRVAKNVRAISLAVFAMSVISTLMRIYVHWPNSTPSNPGIAYGVTVMAILIGIVSYISYRLLSVTHRPRPRHPRHPRHNSVEVKKNVAVATAEAEMTLTKTEVSIKLERLPLAILVLLIGLNALVIICSFVLWRIGIDFGVMFLALTLALFSLEKRIVVFQVGVAAIWATLKLVTTDLVADLNSDLLVLAWVSVGFCFTTLAASFAFTLTAANRALSQQLQMTQALLTDLTVERERAGQQVTTTDGVASQLSEQAKSGQESALRLYASVEQLMGSLHELSNVAASITRTVSDVLNPALATIAGSNSLIKEDAALLSRQILPDLTRKQKAAHAGLRAFLENFANWRERLSNIQVYAQELQQVKQGLETLAHDIKMLGIRAGIEAAGGGSSGGGSLLVVEESSKPNNSSYNYSSLTGARHATLASEAKRLAQKTLEQAHDVQTRLAQSQKDVTQILEELTDLQPVAEAVLDDASTSLIAFEDLQGVLTAFFGKVAQIQTAIAECEQVATTVRIACTQQSEACHTSVAVVGQIEEEAGTGRDLATGIYQSSAQLAELASLIRLALATVTVTSESQM